MNGLVAAAAAAMEDDSRIKGEGVLDRKRRTGEDDVTGSVRMEDSPSANLISASEANKRSKTARGIGISAAKSRRLEQNRRAAIESRRRKKVMVEELQRSVAFYTKANASLSLHNRELETKLILAKQRVQQIGAQATVNHCVDSSNNTASKSEHPEVIKRVSDSPKSNVADVKLGSTLGTPDATVADAVATLCEPNEAQQIGSNVPYSSLYYAMKMTSINGKRSLSDLNQVTVDETEDSYIESLKQFVAQQAAVASAAAASANAAMEAIKYHEMMKANGQTPTARFPLSQFLQSIPAKSPVRDHGQNQFS